jgi:hypothetical protein
MSTYKISQVERISFSILEADLKEIRRVLEDIKQDDGRFFLYENTHGLESIYIKQNDGTSCVRGRDKSYLALIYTYKYRRNTIFLSNLQDGWITLANRISGLGKFPRYSFSLSDTSVGDAKNSMEFSDGTGNIARVVYAMRDPKWVFYQEGAPRPFEDVNLYEARYIKNRIDRDVIRRYCAKIGVHLDDYFFDGASNNISFEYRF